jgi:hypothetical protein
MRGLSELGALVLGLPCLIRLVRGRHTVRIRLVHRRVPSATALVLVAMGLITLAVLRT